MSGAPAEADGCHRQQKCDNDADCFHLAQSFICGSIPGAGAKSGLLWQGFNLNEDIRHFEEKSQFIATY